MDITPPFLVQALYSFKGKNNDELAFAKGDVFKVIQVEEGGWWEGTHDSNTGWFPANYVRQHTGSGTKFGSPKHSTNGEITAPEKSLYKNQVVKDVIESEKAHVAELSNLQSKFLVALEKSELLSPIEYSQLVSNFDDVLEVHRRLLSSVEEESTKGTMEQRIGRIFLTQAPQVKSQHNTYCSNHPRAVCILEKYRDELSGFMCSQGAASPGVLVLTTGLSLVFRRLEKYAGMLQELKRHLEEGHPDSGDTQRSIYVYKDIASSCSAIRRQKEMELEVLSGTIRGWEGDDVARLGEILCMGSVAIGSDHRDRYFVLFPFHLVMLSVSPRMSAFIFEGKLPLSGINVNSLEDSDAYKNALEIVGPSVERVVAVCQTKEDQVKWVDLLRQQIRNVRLVSPVLGKSPPTLPPHLSQSPPPSSSPQSPSWGKQPPKPHNKVWSMSCLRPAPPLRPCLALGKDDQSKKYKYTKPKDYSHDDDVQILQVIEAYCASTKTRYTVNSALLDKPQVLLVEEEKIFVEKTSGNETIVEEKSLVDTVYALKDQVKDLRSQTVGLGRQIEEERRLRKKLENIVRTHLLAGRTDVQWEE